MPYETGKSISANDGAMFKASGAVYELGDPRPVWVIPQSANARVGGPKRVRYGPSVGPFPTTDTTFPSVYTVSPCYQCIDWKVVVKY